MQLASTPFARPVQFRCSSLATFCRNELFTCGNARIPRNFVSPWLARTVSAFATNLADVFDFLGTAGWIYGIVSQGMMPHLRFYGTFPRINGRYVHDERLIPLQDDRRHG